jgi:hypothetical protein
MLPIVMRRQRFWFWLFASAAGVTQCWSYRFWIEPDGVNYLDVAYAYLRHDWSDAINSYWSPLYSWLLASTFYVVRPSAYWESTVLHLLNFVLFLFALRCGEFFISELVNSRIEKSIPDWAIWTVGYSLLLFVSLFWNAAYLDTPDLCTSGLVYIAAGLLIRIRSGGATLRDFMFFGALLGIAYFSKTIMFLVAFAFLAAAGRRRGTVLAFACFVAVTLPWITILSRSVGRITYGDAGPANYIGYVAHSGTPVHPPRIIFTSPAVREFATPIRATYPPWYNGQYWMEGLHPRFEWKAQFRVLVRSAKEYLHTLTGQKEFIAGFLLIFFAWPKLLPIRWHVLMPALWGLSLYALVHVEPRLVGVFFFLFWLILYSGLCIRSERFLKLVIFAIVLATAFKIGRAAVVRPLNSPHVQWQTAQAIRKMGIEPGSQVAVFGHTNEADYWAHLLGVTVVADIQADDMVTYWSAPPGVRTQILSRLSELDIRAVITTKPKLDDWQMIPGTTFGVKLLKNSTSNSNGTPGSIQDLRSRSLGFNLARRE